MRKLLPLLTGVALAACGSDFTSSGDPLTEAEAGELAEVLVEQGFVGFAGSGPQQAPGAEAAAVPFTFTINESGSCDGGGTVSISGSASGNIDENNGTGNLSYDYTVTPNGCQVTTESQRVFTITGDPNIKVSGDLELTETLFDFTFGYDGKFQWTEGTRSGACGVDVTATIEMTFSGTTGELISVTASMQGTVCGYTVNRSLTVG